MEATDIVQMIIGGGALVIGFFLKRAMNQIDTLNKSRERNNTTIALLQSDMKDAKDKLVKHHSSIVEQVVQNNKFEILFTEIKGTLSQIQSTLKKLDK